MLRIANVALGCRRWDGERGGTEMSGRGGAIPADSADAAAEAAALPAAAAWALLRLVWWQPMQRLLLTQPSPTQQTG